MRSIGSDAGEELVNILDEIRADTARMRAEHAECAMDRRFDAIDARFDRIDARFATLEGRVGDERADLMKWSFAFWIGAVVAIAVLAKLIR